MFQRLKFLLSYVHELEGGAQKLAYRAGEYYHVAEEHVQHFLDHGIAEVEGAAHEIESVPSAVEGGIEHVETAVESVPSAVADGFEHSAAK